MCPDASKRMMLFCTLGIAVVFTGTACKKAGAPAPKPVPGSVVAAFDAIDRLAAVPKEMSNLEKGLSPLDKLQQLQRFYNEVLAEANKVNAGELNSIYPGWGDHFESEFRQAIVLGARAIADLPNMGNIRATTQAITPYMDRWDAWYRSHFSDIAMAMHRKYGVEIE